MHVVAFHVRSNEVIRCEPFPDHEPMDARKVAESICDREFCGELSVAPENGHVPSCCGDIRVEFRPDPDNGCVIWSGESFYLDA